MAASPSVIRKKLREIEARIAQRQHAEAGAGTAELELFSISQDGKHVHLIQAANGDSTATVVRLIMMPTGRYLRNFKLEHDTAKERGEPWEMPPMVPVYLPTGAPVVNDNGVAITPLELGPFYLPYTETADEAMARAHPEYAAESEIGLVGGGPDDVRLIVKADQISKFRTEHSEEIDLAANHAQRDAALLDDDWTEYEDDDAPARPVAANQSSANQQPLFPTKQPEVEIVELDGSGPKPVEIDTETFLAQLAAERAKLSGNKPTAPDFVETGPAPETPTPVANVLSAPTPFGANQ